MSERERESGESGGVKRGRGGERGARVRERGRGVGAGSGVS